MAAMGWSAVVRLEVGDNDRLALSAISGLCPIRPVAPLSNQRQVTEDSSRSRMILSEKFSASAVSGGCGTNGGNTQVTSRML